MVARSSSHGAEGGDGESSTEAAGGEEPRANGAEVERRGVDEEGDGSRPGNHPSNSGEAQRRGLDDLVRWRRRAIAWAFNSFQEADPAAAEPPALRTSSTQEEHVGHLSGA